MTEQVPSETLSMEKRQALLIYRDAPPDSGGLRTDVYLARDVEEAMILKDAIIAELKASVATLSRSNTRLRQKIDRLSS